MLEDESDLLAPENFSMVEPGVYRSAFPRTKHIKFIQSLKLKSVIALIPEEYPEAMAEFYNSKNIILLSHGLDGNKWPFKDINHFEFNKALVDVLNENNRPLLIHCNKGKHRTGSLVGCLRKFRGWPLSAIIHEYYMFATPKARLEDLHFIETFDCSLLRLSDTVIGDSSMTWLNGVLDDLAISDTARFTEADFCDNELGADYINSVMALLKTLNFYDRDIEPRSISNLEELQRLLGDRVRYISIEPKLLKFQIIQYLCTLLQMRRLKRLSKVKQLQSPPSTSKLSLLCKIAQLVDKNSDGNTSIYGENVLIRRICECITQKRSWLMDYPIFVGCELSSSNYDLLKDVSAQIYEDYAIRRKMLLKRLYVTIHSFLWGKKVLGQTDDVLDSLESRFQHLDCPPTFYTIEDALMAPISLIVEHSSRAYSCPQKCSDFKNVIIDAVPDRGGRSWQMRPKKSDMTPLYSYSRGANKGKKFQNFNNNSSTKIPEANRPVALPTSSSETPTMSSDDRKQGTKKKEFNPSTGWVNKGQGMKQSKNSQRKRDRDNT